MNWPAIEGIIYSEEDNPHEILGAHVAGSSVLIQTFQPGAKSIRIQPEQGDKSYKMELADEEGFFAALIPGKTLFDYEYFVEYEDGSLKKMKDAYNFKPQITKEDTVLEIGPGIGTLTIELAKKAKKWTDGRWEEIILQKNATFLEKNIKNQKDFAKDLRIL